MPIYIINNKFIYVFFYIFELLTKVYYYERKSTGT